MNYWVSKIFQVLGIAMVVIGIGVKVKFGEYHDFVGNWELFFFACFFFCAIHSIERLDINDWFKSNILRKQFDRVFDYVNHFWLGCVFDRIFGLLRSYQREYMHAMPREYCDCDACDEYALDEMRNLFLSDCLQYSVTMIVLVVFEIGLIHRAYSNRNQLQTDLGTQLNYTLHQADEDPALYASWDFLQNNVSDCV